MFLHLFRFSSHFRTPCSFRHPFCQRPCSPYVEVEYYQPSHNLVPNSIFIFIYASTNWFYTTNECIIRFWLFYHFQIIENFLNYLSLLYMMTKQSLNFNLHICSHDKWIRVLSAWNVKEICLLCQNNMSSEQGIKSKHCNLQGSMNIIRGYRVEELRAKVR